MGGGVVKTVLLGLAMLLALASAKCAESPMLAKPLLQSSPRRNP